MVSDDAHSCADYMLVMALEGDNVAHKLHREVPFHCQFFCSTLSSILNVLYYAPLSHAGDASADDNGFYVAAKQAGSPLECALQYTLNLRTQASAGVAAYVA